MKLFKIIMLVLLGLILVALVGLYQIGVFSVFFPSHTHEQVAPPIPEFNAEPALLLFTKTNSFRHVEGIAAGKELIATLAKNNGWHVLQTENGAVFNTQDLNKFDAVVFLNVTGDNFSTAQQQAFQHWLESGGGWLGIHAAGDGSHKDWPWYMENLIGVEFIAHTMGPQFQEATVVNESRDHPVMAGLPVNWLHTEEWYSWKQSPRTKGFDILATVDEQTYTPHVKLLGEPVDLRMGDHPIVWGRCIGKGRAVYSALGHAAEAYEMPEHRQLLENALIWTMDRASACEMQ